MEGTRALKINGATLAVSLETMTLPRRFELINTCYLWVLSNWLS